MPLWFMNHATGALSGEVTLAFPSRVEKSALIRPILTVLIRSCSFTMTPASLLKSLFKPQLAPNLSELQPTTEFAQPRLSRVKRRSSPARGYKIWVCLFLYGRSLPRHPLTTRTPQIWGVAFSPPEFQGWAFGSTVKQVFSDNPPPKFRGQMSPPKFGG